MENSGESAQIIKEAWSNHFLDILIETYGVENFNGVILKVNFLVRKLQVNCGEDETAEELFHKIMGVIIQIRTIPYAAALREEKMRKMIKGDKGTEYFSSIVDDFCLTLNLLRPLMKTNKVLMMDLLECGDELKAIALNLMQEASRKRKVSNNNYKDNKAMGKLAKNLSNNISSLNPTQSKSQDEDFSVAGGKYFTRFLPKK
jgi:hypothetical protein